MLKLALALLIAGFSCEAAAQTSVQINFTSTAFEVGRTSTGDLLSENFTFSLGSFGTFIPTASNVSDWATNFTVVPTGGSVAWDSFFTQFSGNASLASNAGAFATTNTGYIWGYNTQQITAGVTEWILFTNSSWTFPLNTSADPVFWDINDAGTQILLGTMTTLATDPYIRTAAVPEPSTYAQIVLGLGALGFFAYRRRKAA